MLLGLHIFNQLPKKHHFQLFTQVALIFTGENSWQCKRCMLTIKSSPLYLLSDALTAVAEESRAFHRVVACGGSQGTERWVAPKQTPGLRRALLKPAVHKLCKIKVSDQTAIETVLPEGFAISASYIKYVYSKLINVFLISCIEGSTFLYLPKLQPKISHRRLPQGHTEMISNCIYMPASSKYFPNNA